ncbi:DUF308 domain-containing protein [Ruminococcaceae bacterium OttesenSCG-928-A11]|nr:DUF308 domain-containing protein [Ruminococcaceae bacterium OttesenSCG-928-A11]
MRNLFEKLARYALLRGVLYIALGVLMLIAPEPVMQVIVYVLAGYAITMGIINIVAGLRDQTAGALGFDFVSGAMLIVLGVVMIIFTRGILSVLPIFLGVMLVIAGIARLAEAVGGGPQMGASRILLIVLAVLIAAGGIVIIVNPFTSAVILFQVFGALVVMQGVGEVISYFTFKRIGKQ